MCEDTVKTDASLRAEGVSKSFGSARAVEGVSMAFRRGNRTGIVGSNGAGKTTMINCLSGVERIDEGSITLDGKRIDRLRVDKIARLGVRRTFQLAEHFRGIKAWQFVALAYIEENESLLKSALSPWYGRKEREIKDRAVALLREHGIEQWNAELGELPYGVQKAVDLIRVFSGKPRVALLDEPTSGTSHGERERLLETLQAENDAGGTERTTVIVDHDAEFISTVCDWVFVMDRGFVIAGGEPEEVLHRAEVVEIFTGHGAA